MIEKVIEQEAETVAVRENQRIGMRTHLEVLGSIAAVRDRGGDNCKGRGTESTEWEKDRDA